MSAMCFVSVFVVMSVTMFPCSGAPDTREEFAKLKGIWSVKTLEIEGKPVTDPAVLNDAKIIIDGEKFTTTSMGATYQGTVKLDPTATPPSIDLAFTDGPEKGNSSLGIYKLEGNTWKLCLTLNAKKRPSDFSTKLASGTALETLQRTPDPALEGEWTAISGEMDGKALPDAYVKNGQRIVNGDQITIRFGDYVFMKADFTVDAGKTPKTIDYKLTDGPDKGKVRLGIYEIDGDTFKSCMALPGAARPTTFDASAGNGQTLSVWKKMKKD